MAPAGLLLSLSMMALAGCGDDAALPLTDAAPAADADLPDAGPADAGGPCRTSIADLRLTISPDGVADSQVVPIQNDGMDAYLGIDTGSPLTFLFGPEDGPEYVEHAADVEIGCELYPVSSLRLEAVGPEPFEDGVIVGILGMDYFSEAPSELDYPGRRVVRHLDGSVPTGAGLVDLPVEWTGDRIVVDASLDGEAVRLIYDAGSPHTIWVGQEGRPGDERIKLGTADGATTVAYQGTGALDFAGESLVAPVFRAPTLPYIMEELAELDADGLLGATGLGFRRVVFDLGADRVLLAPRVAP